MAERWELSCDEITEMRKAMSVDDWLNAQMRAMVLYPGDKDIIAVIDGKALYARWEEPRLR